MDKPSEYFNKIKRVINEGGMVKIINKKGIELDITNEIRVVFAEMNTLLKLVRSRNENVNEKKEEKNLYREIAKLKLELKRLNKVKEWLDDERIKRNIYLSSEEGYMVSKLINDNLTDPNAIYEKKKMDKILNNKIDLDLIKYDTEDDINNMEIKIRNNI